MGIINLHMSTAQACKNYFIVSYVSTDASLGRSASTITYRSLSLTIYYYLLLQSAVNCCCCCAVDAADCTADDCAAATS